MRRPTQVQKKRLRVRPWMFLEIEWSLSKIQYFEIALWKNNSVERHSMKISHHPVQIENTQIPWYDTGERDWRLRFHITHYNLCNLYLHSSCMKVWCSQSFSQNGLAVDNDLKSSQITIERHDVAFQILTGFICFTFIYKLHVTTVDRVRIVGR